MTKNVLIVDQSAVLRRMVADALRQACDDPSEFTAVTNGQQELAALAEQAFDLIVTEVAMLSINGLEFATTVACEFSPPPPVVMISAAGDTEVVHEALRRGAAIGQQQPSTTTGIQQVAGPLLRRADRVDRSTE